MAVPIPGESALYGVFGSGDLMKRRIRRLEAWLAAALSRPGGVTAALALFGLAGFAVLVEVKYFQDLFKDNAEAFAWGRQFLGGYGRHPPLTGWIAGTWYSVLPASDWASYLLSRVMAFVSLAGIWLLARRALDTRRAALVVLALMLYPLFIGAKSDRYNNYQVLLALLPLLFWAFLEAYEKRSAVSGALLGLIGGAAAMTIYSAALGIGAVGLAAIVIRGAADSSRRRRPTWPCSCSSWCSRRTSSGWCSTTFHRCTGPGASSAPGPSSGTRGGWSSTRPASWRSRCSSRR
jgi:hypothetical protein